MDQTSSPLFFDFLPTDSPEGIEAVLIDFSRVLIPRIDALWETRKHAKYLEAVAQSTDADPVTLQYLQRNFTPFSSRSVKDTNKVFYGVRLGQVPEVYTTWNADNQNQERLQALQDPNNCRL